MTEKYVNMTADQMRKLYNAAIQPSKLEDAFRKSVRKTTLGDKVIKVPAEAVEQVLSIDYYYPEGFTRTELQAMYDEALKPEETIYSKEYEIVMTGAEIATVVAALNLSGFQVAGSQAEVKDDMDPEMVFADEYQVFDDFNNMLNEIIEGEIQWA